VGLGPGPRALKSELSTSHWILIWLTRYLCQTTKLFLNSEHTFEGRSVVFSFPNAAILDEERAVNENVHTCICWDQDSGAAFECRTACRWIFLQTRTATRSCRTRKRPFLFARCRPTQPRRSGAAGAGTRPIGPRGHAFTPPLLLLMLMCIDKSMIKINYYSLIIGLNLKIRHGAIVENIVFNLQGGTKKWTPNALHITSLNIGRF